MYTCSLTNVIVKRLSVKVLVDPVLLNFENLLTAGTLFPKSSSQNHFQFFCFITEKYKEYICVLQTLHF